MERLQKEVLGFLPDRAELTGFDWFFNHTGLFFSPVETAGRTLFLGFCEKERAILKGRFCSLHVILSPETAYPDDYSLYELVKVSDDDMPENGMSENSSSEIGKSENAPSEAGVSSAGVSFEPGHDEKGKFFVKRIIPIEAALHAYPWVLFADTGEFPEDDLIHRLIKMSVDDEEKQGMPFYMKVDKGGSSFIFEICRIDINRESFTDLKNLFQSLRIVPKKTVIDHGE